jgi:hypothetical protein
MPLIPTLLLDDAQEVLVAVQVELLPVDLHLGPCELRQEDVVVHLHRVHFVADCEHNADVLSDLGGLRQVEAVGGGLGGAVLLHKHTAEEGRELLGG